MHCECSLPCREWEPETNRKMIAENKQLARISFLLDNLTGGGAEKVILNLAHGFSALGHQVDLLVCKVEGVLSNSIPAGVNLVPLESASPVRGLLCAMKGDPAGIRQILGAVVNSSKIRIPQRLQVYSRYCRTPEG